MFKKVLAWLISLGEKGEVQMPGIVPEDDADQLTAEEKALLEKEEKGELEAPPEKPPVTEKQRPPERNLIGENQRLREQRDRIRQESQAKDAELTRLREETLRYKVRRELSQEQLDQLEEAKRLSTRPDPEVDSYGAEMWDLREQLKALKGTVDKYEARDKETEQQRQQRQAQEREATAISEFIQSDLSGYKSEHPEVNYDDAANFLYTKYNEYWTRRGLNAQEVQSLCANNFMALAAAARQRGGSAAQAVVEMSEMFGYKHNGSAPAEPPAPATGQLTESQKLRLAKEKMDRLKKGQSMQGLGGKDSAERSAADNIGALTPEAIAAMDDDEYVAMKQNRNIAPLLAKRLAELG